jgi:hypothetical protein
VRVESGPGRVRNEKAIAKTRSSLIEETIKEFSTEKLLLVLKAYARIIGVIFFQISGHVPERIGRAHASFAWETPSAPSEGI